jgi:hypothetical protein
MPWIDHPSFCLGDQDEDKVAKINDAGDSSFRNKDNNLIN